MIAPSTYLSVLLALSLCFTGLSQAQTLGLDEIIPTRCYHAGQFIQSQRKANLAQPLISYGRFIFSCKRGLIWEIQTPIFESTIYPIDSDPVRITANETDILNGRIHQKLGELLNQLVGGETDYLKKHFHISSITNGLILAPKKSRMSKFIQKIVITKDVEGVNINLVHNAQESSILTIASTAQFEIITAATCLNSAFVINNACTTLFK